MELTIWEGESKWGVPSMDLKSLQMMAYVKFSGAPVIITKTSNPFFASVPSFKCSAGILTEFSEVSAFLRRHNYSCDYELSPKNCSEIVAYEQLLKSKLYPALMYLWWVEPKSYYDVIHKWYYKAIPFPYKLWYPGRYHKENVELMSSLYEEVECQEVLETELHKQAQECLTILSHRLGEKDYFFGSAPTTIDAVIFSYLVLLLKVDLEICVLQNHIKACPNLARFVTRIMQLYFPSEKSGSEEKESVMEDVPNKGRNMLVSGLVAFFAMFGYAVASGLVQVDIKENLNSLSDSKDYQYDQYDDYDNSSGSE